MGSGLSWNSQFNSVPVPSSTTYGHEFIKTSKSKQGAASTGLLYTLEHHFVYG